MILPLGENAISAEITPVLKLSVPIRSRTCAGRFDSSCSCASSAGRFDSLGRQTGRFCTKAAHYGNQTGNKTILRAGDTPDMISSLDRCLRQLLSEFLYRHSSQLMNTEIHAVVEDWTSSVREKFLPCSTCWPALPNLVNHGPQVFTHRICG